MRSPGLGRSLCHLLVALVLVAAVGSTDEIELLNGDRLECHVAEETDEYAKMYMVDGLHMLARVPWAKIHAITVKDVRRVVNEAVVPAPAAPDVALPTASADPELEARIERDGATPPDWWDSVTLEYPTTLDLTWSDATEGWDSSRNLGHYVWDIVNPNPGRWRQGVRLLHRSLAANEGDPGKTVKSIEKLAPMYQNLLRDWSRAAFWWRRLAKLRPLGTTETVRLAECYWRLGDRETAEAVLAPFRHDYSRDGALIRLRSAMGDLDGALALAEDKAALGMQGAAYTAAGDVCRKYGRYADALAFYEGALTDALLDPKAELTIKLARANVEAVRLFAAIDVARLPGGVYEGASIGFNGLVHVAVTVRGGRIEAAKVTEHVELQFYSAVEDTPAAIVREQGVAGVDATTGATITSNAIVNAAAKALAAGGQ